MKQVQEFIKNTLKDRSFWKALLFGCFSFGLMSLYFVFVGIPKTSARNYYNEAVLSIESEDYEEALEFLELSIETYPNTDAENLLEEIENMEYEETN